MNLESIKSFFVTFKEKCKDFRKNIFSTTMNKFRFILVIDLLIKTILFLALVETSTADKIQFSNISIKFSVVYLAFILLLYSFGYLFSKNKQMVFYFVLNTLYSTLLVADLWYFRVNRDFLGIKNILMPGTFNPIGESLFQFRPIDIIFIIDIVIMLIWIKVKKIKNKDNRSIGKFSFTIRYSIVLILLSYIALDVLTLGGWGNYLIEQGWTTVMSARAPGPIGYHLVEATRSISRKLNNISDKDKEDIENWLTYNNENLPSNEYEGIAKGKNVIFLQIESLENFVINKETNGKEITPFLNKLIKESLYFDNIYEQNNAGNSIDCDFMVNTSVFPLGDKITGTNYGDDVFQNSLPRILEKEGYTTISTHAEDRGEFNWTELHKNSFGAQELWDVGDYIYEETVGYGLSDRSMLSQLSEKIKNVQEPFFVQVPTLSNHGPFQIGEEYRELDLPEEVNNSYLGGYLESVKYTDKQIEMFFNKLEESGLLDNTMIVIYGDHAGVHKYYNDDIQGINYEDNWWKDYDHKIPLIIYSKGISQNTIEASGGQVDILPTVSYLLGVDRDLYQKTSMGRVLVNTNRDSTVIKWNSIKGTVKSEEEKEHILNAYSIGDKIIKNNYFSTEIKN